MKCFEGNRHSGPLRDIAHIPTGMPGEEEIIRWCPNCGAIVVDTECDGRLRPGEMLPMQFPKCD